MTGNLGFLCIHCSFWDLIRFIYSNYQLVGPWGFKYKLKTQQRRKVVLNLDRKIRNFLYELKRGYQRKIKSLGQLGDCFYQLKMEDSWLRFFVEWDSIRYVLLQVRSLEYYSFQSPWSNITKLRWFIEAFTSIEAANWRKTLFYRDC